MFIRDARNKYDVDFSGKQKDEPNPYYEGYLNKEDSEFIAGMDYVMNNELDVFIGRLDDFAYDFFKVGFNVHNVDVEIVCSDKGYDDYTKEEKKTMSPETRILLMFLDKFIDVVECTRDEMITSMIDNMDDDEYKENFKKVWGRYPDGDKE